MNRIWQWFTEGKKVDGKEVASVVAGYKLIQSQQRWRRWGLLSLLIIVVLLIGRMKSHVGSHTALIDLRGEISENSSYREILARIEKSKSVKALYIRVNSGGGSAAESEWLYNKIKRIKVVKKIPIVALVEGVAASGALMAILPSDHIIAYNTSVIGSVGALVNVPNISGLMKSVGVDMVDISSGMLKGQPTPYEPMGKQAWLMLEQHVLSIADWFFNLVKKERGLDSQQVDLLKSGRIFVAPEALSLKLIDQIGNEGQVQEWLADKLSKEVPVVEYDSADNKPFIKDFFRHVSQLVDHSEASPLKFKWSR